MSAGLRFSSWDELHSKATQFEVKQAADKFLTNCLAVGKCLEKALASRDKGDDELAYITLQRAVSIYFASKEALPTNRRTARQSQAWADVTKVMQTIATEAEELRSVLQQRYAAVSAAKEAAAEREANKLAATEAVAGAAEPVAELADSPQRPAITEAEAPTEEDFPNGLLIPVAPVGDIMPGYQQRGYAGSVVIQPTDLYTLLDESNAKILLLDLRPRNQYRMSHVASEACDRVNIVPEMLTAGAIGQMVENKLRRGRESFAKRQEYDKVILMGGHVDDWLKPPNEYAILLDAITTYEPTKKLQRVPYVVDGGYRGYYDMYPSECSGRPLEESPQLQPAVASSVDINTVANFPQVPSINPILPSSPPRLSPELSTQSPSTAAADLKLIMNPPVLDNNPLDQSVAVTGNGSPAVTTPAPTPNMASNLSGSMFAAIGNETESLPVLVKPISISKDIPVEYVAAISSEDVIEPEAIAGRRVEVPKRDAPAPPVSHSHTQETSYSISATTKPSLLGHNELPAHAKDISALTIGPLHASSTSEAHAAKIPSTAKTLSSHQSDEVEKRAQVADALMNNIVQPAPGRPTAPKPSGSNVPQPVIQYTAHAVNTSRRSDQKTNSTLPTMQRVDRTLKPVQSGRLSAAVRNQRLYSMQPKEGSLGKGLTGLRNLGNTCFMNSILQCVVSAAPLTKYFVQGRYRNDINRNNPLGHKGELAEEYGELVRAMSLNRYRHVAPRFFKDTLSKLCPQFAGTQQQDSQEFCSFLLDGLHEDLNKVKKKPYIELPDNSGIDDHIASKQALDLHKSRNQSVIADLFQGQFRSTVTCQVCGHKSTTFNSFTFLSVPIVSGSKCTLNQCLDHFSRTELMTGADKWHCPACKCKQEATKTISIWRLPKILIVHLKRFYFEGPFRSKLTTLVEFPVHKLNMAQHHKGAPSNRSIYNLFAVSNHIGDLSGGHYTAYCRNAFTQRWYEFNDSTVSLHTSSVCTRQSYVLFYTAVDFDVDLFG